MHKKILTSLAAALLYLTTLTMSQEEECGGPLSTIAHENITYSLEYYSRCSFPTYKLNVECILTSCPTLSGLCPLTSAGRVNKTGLNSAVSILNTCLNQGGSICGINMAHSPIVQIGWSLANVLPASMASGSIWVNPGTGFIDNLSNANIAVSNVDPTGTITLTIDARDVINTASHNSSITISSKSILRSLAAVIPSLDVDAIDFHNITGIYRLNVSSTVSIDLSTQPPTVAILVQNSNIRYDFSNFVTEIGVAGPSYILEKLNAMANHYLNKSAVFKAATTLLSTYAALSLQAAQQSCTS